MASRLILVCQYIQSLLFMRHFKRTRLPMVLIASTYSIAAVVYLGLFWSFHPSADGSQNNSFIAWYVVAIMETALVTTISCIWRHISFKGTHLVQRMSLLTLIILGEGVIGLAERCSAIVEATVFDISAASTLGNVCCGIFILYFLYMLYFDRIQEKHFGTIRQQIWAFLHFPLHVFLVLAVEGVGQCLIWNAATVADNNLTNDLTDALEQLVNANYTFTTDPSVWVSVLRHRGNIAAGTDDLAAHGGQFSQRYGNDYSTSRCAGQQKLSSNHLHPGYRHVQRERCFAHSRERNYRVL